MVGALPRMLRAVRHSASARASLARVGALYIRLVRDGVRWQVEGREHLETLLARGGGFIPSVWHGRLLMSPTWAPPGRRTIAMISNNRDGDLIAAVVGRFGVHTVRGSTFDKAKGVDKGGREAYRGAEVELVENEAVVAITPDGPRGPRMRAQIGAAMLSLETGAPILPVAFSTRWGRRLGSWDRFFVPCPFGPGALVYGPPLFPPETAAELEAFRERIEAATTRVQDRADDLMVRPRVPPSARPGAARAVLPE